MTQVNTRAAHAAATARMGVLSSAVDKLQGQIATGKRVMAPADDPIAFTRAAVVRRAEAAALVAQRGIDAAARRLTATDNALEAVTNLVQRARELALQGGNGTLAAADRALLATEVGELREQLAGLADARGSDGERLFGGAQGDRAAYVLDAAGVVQWQGGGTAPGLRLGSAVVASGIEGPDAFGPAGAPADPDVFASLAALQVGLAEPDKLVREAAMAASIAGLDGHVDRLATARALAGARGARLDTEAERMSKASLANQADLSKLESLDMAEAIARLQRLMTVLQATQGSFVATTNLSLWDQLR